AALGSSVAADDIASFWYKLQLGAAADCADISARLQDSTPPTDAKSLLLALKEIDRLDMVAQFIESVRHDDRSNLRSVFLGLLLAPAGSAEAHNLHSSVAEISKQPWICAERVRDGL